MKRNAFVMKLKKGCEAEYEKRHAKVWPEVVEAVSKAGVCDYTTFLVKEPLSLFAFQR